MSKLFVNSESEIQRRISHKARVIGCFKPIYRSPDHVTAVEQGTRQIARVGGSQLGPLFNLPWIELFDVSNPIANADQTPYPYLLSFEVL